MTGLRLKLLLPVITLWCVLFAIFNYSWLPSFLDNELQEYNRLQDQQLHLLSDSIADQVSRNDLANIYSTLDHILEEAPYWKYLILRDEEDQLLYPLELPKETSNSELVRLAATHNYSGVSLFTIEVGVDTNIFISQQQSMVEDLRWIFFGLLFAGVVGSLLLDEHFVRRPIIKLASAAKKLSTHDFNTPLPSAGKDEIGDLIKAFEIMRCNIGVYERELMQTRDKALESTRMKSEFLAKISHELRTPLNAILGYCELIREDLVSPKKEINVADLNNISYSGKYLLSIIEHILDLTTIESGKMILEETSFSLPELIYDVVDNLKPLIKTNNNDIRVKLSPEANIVFTDSSKLKQILYNLISNASKFTTDGMITIQSGVVVKNNQTCFYVDIIDTGIGISPEKTDNLFEAFTQVENSYNRKYEGAGLGLSLCKELCQVMQGTITVTSKPAHGSKFSVTLPLKTDEGNQDNNLETNTSAIG